MNLLTCLLLLLIVVTLSGVTAINAPPINVVAIGKKFRFILIY